MCVCASVCVWACVCLCVIILFLCLIAYKPFEGYLMPKLSL